MTVPAMNETLARQILAEEYERKSLSWVAKRVRGETPSSPGDDALVEAALAAMHRYKALAVEECARVAENACLVPPDGGSPTEAERIVAETAAARIRALSPTEGEKP